MIRFTVRPTPAAVVSQVQQAFSYTDEHLSLRFGVPVETIKGWRDGTEIPTFDVMKRMNELLRLNQALINARSGKYRQA